MLIIDLQKGLFHADPPPWQARKIVERINECADAFRGAGAPVFLIQHDGTEEEGVAPETDGWQLVPELRVSSQDARLRKTACDAFQATTLHPELRKWNIHTVVIAGYATEFCIESTVRAALGRGYRVWVVSDAHTTNDSPVLPAAKIVEHHNQTWPECAANHPVRLITSRELTRALDPTRRQTVVA